ncbi:MAG: DUF1080 domain-containing protein [Firmicutes bacterium]|nr:DUF1080 domain-containing protein [Bacillota bacterium]
MEKVMLFDGKDASKWRHRDGSECKWTVRNGCMTVKPGTGDIYCTENYSDAMLHVEFRCPDMPEASGQGKGNSGVYLHGCYEIQVLDSYELEPMINGCGSLYCLATVLSNPSRPPMEWQTYDIIFRAPRFDEAGNITEKGRLTLLFNGECVHNNLELERTTPGGLSETIQQSAPLLLQDHGNLVSFRNIWLVRL